jgi:hypothetical protein
VDSLGFFAVQQTRNLDLSAANYEQPGMGVVLPGPTISNGCIRWRGAEEGGGRDRSCTLPPSLQIKADNSNLAQFRKLAFKAFTTIWICSACSSG